jgi:hypothetical protein
MNGDGIDTGITTGEQFGHFVYWVVVRHPKGKFTNEPVDKMIRDEFPDHHLAHGGRGAFQKISLQRSYAKNSPDRLGIHSDVEAAEVLSRIDEKMRLMPAK